MEEDFSSDRVSARIVIESSTLTPEEISSRLGILWNQATRVGQPRGHAGRLWEVHTWALIVEKQTRDYALSAHALLPMCVDELLTRIKSVEELLRDIIRSEGGEFAIRLSCASVPGITLNEHVIRVLADLGLSLDIDVILY